MNDTFQALLDAKGALLADGATGTNYFDMGLKAGDAPEFWNIDHPDRVARLHQEFVVAGADILLTNTFGGNRYRLALHQADDRVGELNRAAARIARAAATAAMRPVLIAGSMGPTGEIFAPLGSLTQSDGEAAFLEQAEALKDGGADLLWLETLSSKEEVQAGLTAAARVDLPAVCTVSFDTNGATMMGVTPSDFATFVPTVAQNLVACGTNCGIGASEVVACIKHMQKALEIPVVLVAKANCGIPRWENDAIAYDGTPALMAEYVRLAHAAGARVIGGCCGTSPSHLASMRAALDAVLATVEAPGSPELDAIESRLGSISDGIKAQITGEGLPAPRVKTRRGGRRRR